MNVAAEQRKLEARFKGLRDEKEALLAEQTERVEKKTELELRIRDLREDVEKERSGRVSYFQNNFFQIISRHFTFSKIFQKIKESFDSDHFSGIIHVILDVIQDKAEEVLTKLKADIAARQEELNGITPKYATVGEEMAKLNTEYIYSLIFLHFYNIYSYWWQKVKKDLLFFIFKTFCPIFPNCFSF